MKIFKNGKIALILLLLASCSSDELGPHRDVAYLVEHNEERKAIIEICANDPGRYQFHPNCENALEAQKKRMLTGSNAVPPPPPIEELIRINPPDFYNWPKEERERYNAMTVEERTQYVEERQQRETN